MKKQLNAVKDELFSKVHGNNLIYNTCWEDPKIDRELLDINENSEIVMLTSAGCNALSYLLDNPSQIHTVDVNFRQNALLELKKVLLRVGNYERLFSFFGNGYDAEAEAIYNKHLSAELPKYAKDFWDKKKYYFFKNKKKKSFYFYGTAGVFALLFNNYLHRNKTRSNLINRLFSCTTIEDQQEVYNDLEPILITKFTKWLMNRHLTMSLLGVPRSQRKLILDEYPEGGVGDFLQERLKHIFTQLPIQENYFWYLYTYGRYSKSNCPDYLKEDNFNVLSQREDRIITHTSTLERFLQDHPKKYTHYVLLDHQDWLAHYDPAALQSEWKEILKNSKPGTKILMRSASMQIDFFPDFVKEAVTFSDMAKEKHINDRVGTYGSTYLAIVN